MNLSQRAPARRDGGRGGHRNGSDSTVDLVAIHLGPVPSASARAWLSYARAVLGHVPTEAGIDGIWLPADAVVGFEWFLDEWEAAADEDETFRWEGEVPREQAEYFFHAFFRLVNHLAARAEADGPQAPPESGAFYQALVGSLLEALEHEGETASDFYAHLRDFWPGLEA